MCAAGPCLEKPAGPRLPEGGLDTWREDTPLTARLYLGQSAVASARYLFVSGGQRLTDANALEANATIYVADLDGEGTVANWRVGGALPVPLAYHAMAVLTDRLYVVGGPGGTVMSYPIGADGLLGTRRDEPTLPTRGSDYALLVDATGPQPRLLAASVSGGDAFHTSDGAKEIMMASPSGGSEGGLGAWSTAEAPTPIHALALAAGSLFVLGSGKDGDSSSGAMYGIRVSSLTPGVSETAFVPSAVWPSHIGSRRPSGNLAASCDTLVWVGYGGSLATAPVDAVGHVGIFRAATDFDGVFDDHPITVSPSGRIYVVGGFNNMATGVHSTRRTP
jgi:hypothetical protein